MPWNLSNIIARIVKIVGPGDGLFVYSPSEGAGHLVKSITDENLAVYNDPYGNPIIPGDTSYIPNVSAVNITSHGGVSFFYWSGTSWLPGGAIVGGTPAGGAGSTGIGISGVNAVKVILGPTNDASGSKDLANIQGVLNRGFPVELLPGTYYINNTISIPANGRLSGAGSGLLETSGSTIAATAGFADSAVITFPLTSQSQEIRDISFDGSLMPAGKCECIGGISISHSVLSVKLKNLYISGLGFTSGVGSPNGGTTWRGERIMVHGVSGIGFNLSNAPDSTWIDCLSLSAGQYGWRVQGSGNAKIIGCRAENSGLHGWYLTGISSNEGGLQFIGCSTDGNTNDGIRIDMTGACPVSFTDLQLREDGKAGAGNYAFHATASATVPWMINGLKTFPGTNGGSTGEVPGGGIVIDGPQSLALISEAMVMSATTPVTGMSSANNISWRNVWINTGTPSVPGTWTAVGDSA